MERFLEKCLPLDDGCLQWNGALNSKGYGIFAFGGKGKTVLAHRWIYEQKRGAIPKGMQIDHVCNFKRCMNEDHMRPATARENVLARHSSTITGANSRKTHCVHGHPLSGDNLLVKPNGGRQCRTCARAQKLAFELRKNASGQI